MKFRAILSLAIFMGVIGFGFVSCKKNRKCKALIIVQDSLEEPILGANVRLWCDDVENPLCIVDDTATTRTDGTASFEFANPAILKVYVNTVPKGYIELKSGETVEKIVTIP